MVAIGYLKGGRLDVWRGKGIAIVIYLALVSAIAYTVWSLLLHHNNVSKVAVFGCLNLLCRKKEADERKISV